MIVLPDALDEAVANRAIPTRGLNGSVPQMLVSPLRVIFNGALPVPGTGHRQRSLSKRVCWLTLSKALCGSISLFSRVGFVLRHPFLLPLTAGSARAKAGQSSPPLLSVKFEEGLGLV